MSKHASPWWTASAVRRLLSDLILDELSRLRPGARPPARDLAARSGPGPEPVFDRLDLDSLELLDLATSVATRLHLYDTGFDRDLLARRRLDDWVAIVLESRAHWDRAIGFLTSGSTGRPSLHDHPLAFLEQEIEAFADLLTGCRRVLVTVPVHHIYGFLFGFMLPTRLDVPVSDIRDGLPGGALARAQPGDLLIAHPAWLELATRGSLAAASGVTVVTSTAPCPEAVWHRLRAGGVARVLEIYGASETAGIGTREAPDAPFELLPHWSRAPGAELEIQRSGSDGEPVTRALPDLVRWIDARRFQVRGRRDGAVQIGGVNVFPERVRRCLRAHPEVAEAGVRLASPEQGGRLKAFVVPIPGCADPEGLPERLRVWCAERLSPVEQPRALTLGSQLPRSPLGKLLDWDPE